ncbi:MAG: NAD(+) synthase [Gudongella sp.]|nr:NAD(+) synthase [Gudongella sp.]
MKEVEKTIDNIVKWIQENLDAAGAKGLVFGLSGGIDSAVIAGLAKLACPGDSLGIIMPINSNPQDEKDARLVSEALNLDVVNVDLTPVYESFLKTMPFEGENKLAQANLKPRLRMMTLYYYAQEMGYLVCGSSNRSEFEVGYFTKHGDSGVDMLPLADFVKGDIRELAAALGVPHEVIVKPPTAGLWENQTDEKEMGFSYDVLDNYILTGEGPEEIVEKIKRMNRNSEHKRQYPPIYKNK